MNTIGILTLGCPKNKCDSDIMRAKLLDNDCRTDCGFELADNPYESDIIIINTCGFIQSAKEEAIAEILDAAERKQAGIHKKIIVTGCLAQRYKTELSLQFPEADAVLGLSSDIAGAVKDLLAGEERIYRESGLDISGNRAVENGASYAYLRIADGCDNFCSYCAIPHFRGRYRSRAAEEIVREAEELARSGVSEIVLVAQDTTAYGADLGNVNLAELLKLLVKTDIPRIRLLYCYPERITDELIQAIKTEDKICKYLDLPIQHCNAEILKKMNRAGDKNALLALIAKLRGKIPNIALRTTFIAGFPGETEDQFEELAEFAHEVRFTHMGAFAYSEEEGTVAALMPEQIEESERRRRADILEEQQEIRRSEYLYTLRGKVVDVVTDGYDGGYYIGRSGADAPEIDDVILFRGTDVSGIVRVKITDVIDDVVYGEVLH